MYVLGIKIHMGEHFPESIPEFGAPDNYDMAHYERAHKPVKEMFEATSKRLGSTPHEIVRRTERVTVIKAAIKAFREFRQVKSPRGATTEVKHRTLAYKTEDAIVYEAYCSKNSAVRVMWSQTRGKFTVMDAVQFLNPLVSVEDISKFLESEIVATMEHLQPGATQSKKPEEKLGQV